MKICHVICVKWNFDIHNLLKILNPMVDDMPMFFTSKGLNSRIKAQD